MNAHLAKTTSQLLALGFMAIGCGPSFQFKTAQQGVSSSSTAHLSDNQLNSSMGSLAWNVTTLDNADIQYTYNLKVPFARVYQPTAQVISQLAPLSCTWIEGIDSSSPTSYAPGEIPCGVVATGDGKEILNLNISSYSSKLDGFNVGVTGVSLPIFLSRTALHGTYSEASLDTKTTVSKTSSTYFGHDVSVKFAPNGTAADLEICLNVPGATISSAAETVQGTADTRILGVKISYGSSFTIDPGHASYDYGRGCLKTEFEWSGQSTAPTLSLTTTETPHLVNLTYAGLHIQIGNWFLRMVDEITGYFGTSIKNQAIARVQSTANNYADNDFESGRWFSQMNGQAILNAAGAKFNQQMALLLTRVGIPSSVADFSQLLSDQCLLMKLSSNPNWNADFDAFCTHVVSQVKISIQPFAVDADSKAAGCYDYFANLQDSSLTGSQAKWWAQTCQFAAEFSVTLPKNQAQYQKQLQSLLQNYVSVSQIPADWQSVLNKLGVDSYTFMLSLVELETQAHGAPLTAALLEQLLPAIAAEITQKLAL